MQRSAEMGRFEAGFMSRHGCHPAFFPAWALLILSMLCGCGGGGNRDLNEKVLIRAGGSVVTVRDFHEAFESGITSPSRLFQDPEALRDEKYRILNRLTEELLILERARELNLRVGDGETARVVDDLKKDFPDDTFEKTLRENGISFPTWKKALKRRLLMEKVVRKDLSETSFRTPLTVNGDRAADDTKNPPENVAENADASGDDAPPGDDEDLSGTPARTTAAEVAYPEWINRLKQQYAIEIDWKLWEIIEQESADGV